MKSAEMHQWRVIAWVVRHNHYHALLEAPENALTPAKMVASCHKFTARSWNDADRMPGRRVWWNYRDTCIRSEKEYAARLGYIFCNPVRHDLVQAIEAYPFSSYRQYPKDDLEVDFTGWSEVKYVPEF